MIEREYQEERVKELNRQKWWRRFTTLWLILFSLVAAYNVHRGNNQDKASAELALENKRLGITNRELIKANQARIEEIQQARKQSCQETYEGVRQILRPFFPKAPKDKTKLTPALKLQLSRLKIFNHKVDSLKRGCPHQVQSNQ